MEFHYNLNYNFSVDLKELFFSLLKQASKSVKKERKKNKTEE
jgi:hypothetical protein